MVRMEDVYVPAPRVAFRRIGKQVALVNASTNQLLTLNETGSVTWESLDGRNVGEVVNKVASHFSSLSDNVAQEVCTFLQSLIDRQLVTRPGEESPIK